MKYCSNCGEKVTFQEVADDHKKRFVCNACTTIHYENPKIIGGCLPIWEDKVMLCLRAIEPRKGFWNVPAGFMENGETIEHGAAREVEEEACIKVEILNLHTVYSIPQIGQVHFHYLAQMPNLDFAPGVESLDVKLFTESEIPWDEIAFTSSKFSLKNYFEDRKKGLRSLHSGSYVQKKT